MVVSSRSVKKFPQPFIRNINEKLRMIRIFSFKNLMDSAMF